MPFNLLLLPLLGGFVFFSHWDVTASFAKRQDKERLLLYSSLFGLFFLAIALLLSALVPHFVLLSSLRHWWAYNTPPIQFSGISSFAFLLGAGGQWILNRSGFFDDGESLAERDILNYGGELERLLYIALKYEKRVMITLKTERFISGV